MAVMVSWVVAAAAAAPLRRSRAASYKNPAFLSPYKHLNIHLNAKRWTSNGSNSCGICTTNGTSTSGMQEDDSTTFVCKEDFEVGSRMVSFTTAMNTNKTNLLSYSPYRIKRKWDDESITKGEVVMGIEKTKIVSIAEAKERSMGGYCLNGRFYELMCSYNENEFLHAQREIHSAKQKKFPSHALMRRPSLDDVIFSSFARLFDKGYYSHDVVYATTDVLQSDGQQDPVIMAANNTSAALMVSGIHWGGPVGFVRVGRIRGSEDGAFVINPTMDQIIFEGLDLNLVYARTRDKTLMIELEAREVSDRDVEAALRLAHHEAEKYIEPQIRLAERSGARKNDYKLYMNTDHSSRILQNKVKSFAEPRFKEAIISRTNYPYYDKFYRRDQVWDEIRRDVVLVALREECDSIPLGLRNKIVPEAVDSAKKNAGQRMIIEKGIRVDGRRLDQVREPQYCESGALPVQYGSSFFWLGHTQVRSRVELQNSSYNDDGEYYRRTKFRFTRNTIWNRTLESAFVAVLPPEDDFPYHVGAYAEDSGHGGVATSYIASICGASLALMDAGIPLRASLMQSWSASYVAWISRHSLENWFICGKKISIIFAEKKMASPMQIWSGCVFVHVSLN